MRERSQFRIIFLQILSSRGTAVVPDNLFTAITTMNPGEGEIVRFWAPWTETPGFPLVTVKRDNITLKLTQKRFMRSGINHDHKELYNIPINYAIDSDNYVDTAPKFIFRLEEGTTEKQFNLTKTPQKYFILNVQQTGYYRVNYDEGNWKNISEALHTDNHDNIHVLNRAQIVDDLFNLARADIVEYSRAIDIIRYIKKEKNYIPWLSAINNGLTFLSQRVSGEKDQEVFAWFIRDLMDEIYKHLTYTAKSGEKRTDIYNRVNILTWACKYGHDECIKLSKDLFESYKSGTKVHKDHRSIVYCSAVRHGGAAEFDVLYDKLMNTDIAAEQLNLLIGMACTKDQASVTVKFEIF